MHADRYLTRLYLESICYTNNVTINATLNFRFDHDQFVLDDDQTVTVSNRLRTLLKII